MRRIMFILALLLLAFNTNAQIVGKIVSIEVKNQCVMESGTEQPADVKLTVPVKNTPVIATQFLVQNDSKQTVVIRNDQIMYSYIDFDYDGVNYRQKLTWIDNRERKSFIDEQTGFPIYLPQDDFNIPPGEHVNLSLWFPAPNYIQNNELLSITNIIPMWRAEIPDYVQWLANIWPTVIIVIPSVNMQHIQQPLSKINVEFNIK